MGIGPDLWGHFQNFERVTFGACSDSHFSVKGIKVKSPSNAADPRPVDSRPSTKIQTHSIESEEFSSSSSIGFNDDVSSLSENVPQLILQCSSVLSSGIYCRLLKRCLLATAVVVEDAILNNSRRNHAEIQKECSSISAGFSSLPRGSVSMSEKSKKASNRAALSSSFSCPTSSSSSSSSPPSSSPSSFPSSSSSFPSSSSSSSFPSSSSSSDQYLSFVPGGGAAEMGWSSLWRLVALQLNRELNPATATNSCSPQNSSQNNTCLLSHCAVQDDAQSVQHIGADSDRMYTEMKSDVNDDKPTSDKKTEEKAKQNEELNYLKLKSKTFTTKMSPLADIIASDIVSRIMRTYNMVQEEGSSLTTRTQSQSSNKLYRRALKTTIHFCSALSHAYAQIPKQLLLNASQNNGNNKITKKCENIWKIWCDHYEHNLCPENAEYSVDAKNVPGRLGLISALGNGAEGSIEFDW